MIILDSNFYLHKKKILKIYEAALMELGYDDLTFCLSLNFVSEEEIKKLNNKHRGVDKITDVLSFPLNDVTYKQSLRDFVDVGNEIYLGDIVICKDKAKSQAVELNHSFSREICFLALHGFLHLLGYDHMVKEDEKVMLSLSDKILQNCGVKR